MNMLGQPRNHHQYGETHVAKSGQEGTEAVDQDYTLGRVGVIDAGLQDYGTSLVDLKMRAQYEDLP